MPTRWVGIFLSCHMWFMGRLQINRHCSHPNNDQNASEIVADDLMQIQPQIPVTECNLKIQHRDGHRMMITSTESFAFSAIKVFINGDA